MFKYKVPYVNLSHDHSLIKKQILAKVSKLLHRGDFILGEETKIFEERFAQYCGTRYALGVNSGTDALFLSLKVLNIKPGDEVITTPNSFLATASAITAVGAKPVFVDVTPEFNMDPKKLDQKITPKTKALIPVHLTGRPADMDPIMNIAKKHNLHVIEDAAQSIGALYKGKKTGSFGVANCFSLHPLKTLNACGDGGMITTNDASLYQTLLQLRNIGLKNRVESDVWGYNSRLDTLQASILNIKFKYINNWIQQRRKNADYYRKNLSDVVACPDEQKHEFCPYHLFVIQTDRRDELQAHLDKNGIETKIHYSIPIHLQKCAQSLGYKKGDFPVAEKQAERILSLPIYQTLTLKQMELIVRSIRKFFNK